MLIERYFPNLTATGYAITNAPTAVYNCIAFAAGVTDDWWWPDPMGVSYWPAAARRDETIAAFIEAFQTLGYALWSDDHLEPDFEKVALYARDGVPKHAARQLPNGKWTSKLGELEDVEHTLDGIAGDWYGTVVQILRRRRPTT